MTYFRANVGGGGVNMASPDVVSKNTVSGSDSRSLTVTKKPRYVIVTAHAYSGTERLYTWIYDVNKNVYSYQSYYNGYSGNDNVAGLPACITSVTSTSVTIKNPVSSQSMRMLTWIYY